jgi:isopenicillin-N epimerase
MPSPIGRRAFLSRVAATGVAAGLAPAVAAAARIVPLDGVPRAPFIPPQEASDAAVFAEARRHFLIPEGVAYGNTGTLGASPREVVDALVEGTRRLETELADWPYFQADGEPLTGYQELKSFREAAGKLVNAAADEIALTQNATMGMNCLGNGLDFAAGDEVLSTDQEHGGAISVFRLLAKRHGIVLRELHLDAALAGGPDGVVTMFADAMTPRTKAIMFSHVTSGFGIVFPARELCDLARARGALSLVDGAQAVGQIPVDVKALGCDAYVASPHKWLMAPKGTGILYIRRDVQDRFWTTLASSAWDDHERGAFRFMQYGTGAVPVVDGLLAALQFIEKVGLERITRWDARLTKRLRDGLARIPKARLSSPEDPRFAAAITTFRVEGGKARDLQNALWERKVRVRAQSDARGVRLSAHMYMSPADIDTVLEVVSGL